MKSAEDRLSNELAEPLDRPTVWRILVQGQMCSAFVVIGDVSRNDPAQMAFAEDDGKRYPLGLRYLGPFPSSGKWGRKPI